MINQYIGNVPSSVTGGIILDVKWKMDKKGYTSFIFSTKKTDPSLFLQEKSWQTNTHLVGLWSIRIPEPTPKLSSLELPRQNQFISTWISWRLSRMRCSGSGIDWWAHIHTSCIMWDPISVAALQWQRGWPVESEQIWWKAGLPPPGSVCGDFFFCVTSGKNYHQIIWSI